MSTFHHLCWWFKVPLVVSVRPAQSVLPRWRSLWSDKTLINNWYQVHNGLLQQWIICQDQHQHVAQCNNQPILCYDYFDLIKTIIPRATFLSILPALVVHKNAFLHYNATSYYRTIHITILYNIVSYCRAHYNIIQYIIA